MSKEQLHHYQLQWLQQQYHFDEGALEKDLDEEWDYIQEILKFCPAVASLFTQLHHREHTGFVDAPMSTFNEEAVETLPKLEILFTLLRASQWTVFRSVVDQYKKEILRGTHVPEAIVVIDQSTGIGIVKDGHHRVTAYLQLHQEGKLPSPNASIFIAVSSKALHPQLRIYQLTEMRIENR